jgi:hypothetical protein
MLSIYSDCCVTFLHVHLSRRECHTDGVWVFPESGNFPRSKTPLSTKKEVARDWAGHSPVSQAAPSGLLFLRCCRV